MRYYKTTNGVHYLHITDRWTIKLEATLSSKYKLYHILFDRDWDEGDIRFGIAFWRCFFSIALHGFRRPYTGLENLERTLGISWIDDFIMIHLWEDRTGWGPTRHITLTPIDWIFGRTKYSKINVSDWKQIEIPMPEKSYPAKAQTFTSVWKRPRWFGEKRINRVVIDVPGGIPHPGKGTASYNIGDDATFGITCPAETIDEAVQQLINSVNYCRDNYPL